MFRVGIIVALYILVLSLSSYSQNHYCPPEVFEKYNLIISDTQFGNWKLFPYKPKRQNQIKKIDSIIVANSNNNKVKIRVLYNNLNQISEAIFYEFDNGNILYNIRTIYKYDSLNRMISKLNMSWYGKWENFLFEEFKYNVGDTLLKYQCYFWKDNGWTNSHRYIELFDPSSGITAVIRENYQNGIWMFSTKTSSQKSPDKLIQIALNEKWNDSSWEYYSMQTAKFDDKQRILLVLSQYWNGNSWDDYAKMDYSYSNNNEETSVLQVFQNNEWINYESFYYKRDSAGWFLNGKHKMWVDNKMWIESNGPISVINPDGLEIHYLSKEITAYYTNPLAVKNEKPVYINSFELLQNYPNPFNPSTNISYQINEKGFVTLKVYDIIGKEVAALVNETKTPGKYSVSFNASNLPSGVYVYSLRVNSFVKNNKMTLMK